MQKHPNTSTAGATSTGRNADPDYDAIVVGAGVAGLYQLYRLREMGLKVRSFDAASEVGGTWYWNRYPGARVDSQSYIYQYWFSEELLQEWDWSQRFPAQEETERYLNFVADKFDLRKDIQFNTRVSSAHWDEACKRWFIQTEQGDEVTARYFVSCAGMLSAPLVPPFADHEKFTGQIAHTARWPAEGIDLAGKRVVRNTLNCASGSTGRSPGSTTILTTAAISRCLLPSVKRRSRRSGQTVRSASGSAGSRKRSTTKR